MYELFTTTDSLCPACRSKLKTCDQVIQVEGMEVHALYWYNEGMRDFVHRIKTLYDESLAKVFRQDLRFARTWKYRKCYKVCVPSSAAKTEERGFHVVKAMFDPWDVQDDFVKEDVKQSLMSAVERRQIADAIKLKNADARKHTHILLVDDVCTTGSSLKACYELLKTDENLVSILVLAMHPSWDPQSSLTSKQK